jgi:regulator of protease activity HflC (stomatin/prohibitin superfamily)
MNSFTEGLVGITLGILFFAGVTYGAVAAYQPFKVWVAGYDVKKQRLVGEAEFARAEQNRMILVEQARAEMEAAQLRADAIAIVGQATQDFPEYRQQEFIGALGDALRNGNITQIMYLPTEAGIPITEAARLRND